MTIQVLNGANLGRLGTREPDKYGATTYAELVELVESAAGDPVVLNPAGWSHTSVVLRDALAMLTAPLVEVHISNIHQREGFRHHSYVSAVADGVIAGLGVQGYVLALRWLADKGVR